MGQQLDQQLTNALARQDIALVPMGQQIGQQITSAIAMQAKGKQPVPNMGINQTAAMYFLAFAGVLRLMSAVPMSIRLLSFAGTSAWGLCGYG